MLWLLLDITLGVVAFLTVASAGFVVYRRGRALTRTVGDAGTRVDEAMARIGAAPQPAPEERQPTT